MSQKWNITVDGEAYTAPWGDVLKIDEVKTYWKVSDRPFYDEMNDDEKIEICKYFEDIRFRFAGSRQIAITGGD